LAYIDRKGKGRALEDDTQRGGSVEVLNNLDWFKGISFLEFLRTVGKEARVNVMLSRDR
jgi:tyrosyl-tRNA synthetase